MLVAFKNVRNAEMLITLLYWSVFRKTQNLNLVFVTFAVHSLRLRVRQDGNEEERLKTITFIKSHHTPN